MFRTEHEPLALLVELTPRLAKKRFREEIYKDWEHKCAYCGAKATSLDHIVPKYKSGCSNRHNLVPACTSCNANKGSESMESWYRKQIFFNESKFTAIINWIKSNTLELVDTYMSNKATA
jgi:5-methylcytosine-specific restriction endonuclease McrA|tara:strand:- start:594 stop:953 length:360 start_codon:yes stop_codon:yes gene_type:complete